MKSLGSGRRILLAVLAAAILIVLLQVSLGGDVVDAAEAPLQEPPPASTRLPDHLRRRASHLFLVEEISLLPESTAPVVEILEDGDLAFRRPAPMPDGPLGGPWPAAGIVLPRGSLTDLTPVQRVAFLDLCAGFSGGRSLPPERVEGLGFSYSDEELRRLLYWLR